MSSLRQLAVRTLMGSGIFVVAFAVFSAARAAWIARQPLPGLAAAAGARCPIWFVGSSTISRWRGLAADMAPWPVANRGVAGANLDQIGARFGRDGPAPAPAAIVFYAGENDVAEGRDARTTAAEMERLLADAARRYPAASRLVVQLKPSPARWPQRATQLAFSAMLPGIARRTGSLVVADGEQLLADGRPDPALYADDGIHLNERGYKRWIAPLRGALDRAVPSARLRCTTRR